MTPAPASPPGVLFVCTGNICRSPTAHALLQHKARLAGLELRVDSAGVSDEEGGRPFERRAAAELRRRGVPPHEHRARQVRREDFDRFGWVVGMTRDHCALLRRLAPPARRERVVLMLDLVPGHAGADVPDPWYGDAGAFVHAFDLIERGVDGLMRRLRA